VKYPKVSTMKITIPARIGKIDLKLKLFIGLRMLKFCITHKYKLKSLL